MLIRSALSAANVTQDAENSLFRRALSIERLADSVLRFCQCDEEVLARHVLILQQLGLGECTVEDLLHVLAEVLPGDARTGDDGEPLHRVLDCLIEYRNGRSQPIQDGHHDAVVIPEESLQEMRRFDALMVARGGKLHCLLHRLLRFNGKLLEVHSIDLQSLRQVTVRLQRVPDKDEDRAGDQQPTEWQPLPAE